MIIAHFHMPELELCLSDENPVFNHSQSFN